MASPDLALAPLRRARDATYAVFFLNGFVFANWAPRIAETQSALGLSEGQLGLALLMSAIGSLIAMPLVGGLVGRFGAARVITLGACLHGLTLPTLALAGSLTQLGAALMLFGAAMGATDVAMNGHAVSVERAYRRVLLNGFHGFFSLGTVLGAVSAAGFIALGAGRPLHFSVIALLGLATALSLYPRYLDDRDRSTVSAPRAALDPFLLLMGALALIALMTEGAMQDWSSVYITRVLGGSPLMAALAFAAFTACMTVGRFMGDRVVERIGRARGFTLGCTLSAASLATMLLLPGQGSALIGFALTGLGLSITFPALIGLAAARVERPGPAIATLATFGYGGFLIGPPLLGGLAEQFGLSVALGLLVPLLLSAALLGATRLMR